MNDFASKMIDTALDVLKDLASPDLAGRIIGEALNYAAGDGLEKKLSEALRVAADHIDPSDSV